MKEFDRNWLLEWSFKERNESLLAHKIHRYPAVFIPELAEKIIKMFSDEGDTVLDIFSGSGTTLLESMKLKRKSIGIELNPLAILVSHVKTQFVDESYLRKNIEDWKEIYFKNSFPENNITNKDFWFHTLTNSSVNDAIGSIKLIEDELIRNFMEISLSEIIREISYCRHDGFKSHRDKKKIESNFSFNKQKLMEKLSPVLERNILAIQELKQINNKEFKPSIYFHDSRILCSNIKTNSVDLILTSPPYGDSKTTVAYGQFSSFSSELLGLNSLSCNPIRQLDNELLGGVTKNTSVDELRYNSITIRNIQELFLARINLSKDSKEQKKIRKRLKDILSFYDDLDKCIENGANYLKPNGFFVLVTASRIVHETKLHTDIITSELAQNYGLKLRNIYFRDIHNKRMPRKVSATNIVGETTSTMKEESIIILQKI